jgi:hypothetical protein
MDATEALRHIQMLAFNALDSDDVETLQRTLHSIVVLTEKALPTKGKCLLGNY